MPYEYDADTYPSMPPDYVVPDSPTDIELLEQVIHNQEKELEFLYFQLHKEKDYHQELIDENDAVHNDNALIVEKLDALITQGQTGDSTLSDSNTAILQKLDNINDAVSVGSSTVLTYGVLYIPLAIIVFLLVRFFWAFLRPLR